MKDGRRAFLVEPNFGIQGKDDKIAVIPDADDLALLRLMKIQGNDFEISNKDIVSRFAGWQKQFRYRITGVGIDFIEADFIDPPGDYIAPAKEIYAMCPDVVDRGTGSVEELAKEMERTKSMYFWWD